MNDPAQPNTEEKKNAQRLFYVLRLWQVDGPQGSDWRASLENPGTGQRIGFASLEQLFGYVLDLTEGCRCEQPSDDRI
jgi:hypothetical protein